MSISHDGIGLAAEAGQVERDRAPSAAEMGQVLEPVLPLPEMPWTKTIGSPSPIST